MAVMIEHLIDDGFVPPTTPLTAPALINYLIPRTICGNSKSDVEMIMPRSSSAYFRPLLVVI
jgi:hypothetical protein